MIRQTLGFNLYLAVIVAGLAMSTGCQSTESKDSKQYSTLRLHLEVNPDASNRSEPVPIFRSSPVTINVEKAFFLDEAAVAEAKVIDTPGGFSIRVQFDRRGTWMLEQYSVANHGARVGIMSQFFNPDDPKKPISRWLAAPRITKRITDGVLLFTPDATRDEAYRIVSGLNNVAKKTQEKKSSL